MIKATIITIGDEILIGQTIDTNSAWLGENLSHIGIAVTEIRSIKDDKQHITNSVDEAISQADIVLITGGLGPTKDDITKSTLAEYFNTPLVVNDSLLEMLDSYYKRRGREMPESARSLAMVPEDCTLIRNPGGTAAGMWFEKEGSVIISMPGVPFEMKAMMTETVLSKLKEKFSPDIIVHKTLMTAGLPESILASKIEDIEASLPEHIKLAYLPNLGIVRLRLSGRGANESELKEEIKLIAEKISERIPKYHYGWDELSLAEAIQNLCIKKNVKLALAESCTGGRISSEIVKIPGSSGYYKGGIVAYDYDVKYDHLNVSREVIEEKGAVSPEVVEQMAKNVIDFMDADYSIGISGIAGPGGGTPDKPVGSVWIGLASKEKVESRLMRFPFDRVNNIKITSNYALFLLLRFIKEGSIEGAYKEN